MALADYFKLIDELRELRRSPTYKPGDGRSLLDRAADEYERMSDEEQDEAERQGGRSWPDLWDAQQREKKT